VKFQNLFGVYIGGVDSIPAIREGRIRSQGAFGHPILAGTCAAFLLPIFFILWKNVKTRSFAVIGATASTVMVITSASSTSALAFIAGIIAICFWPIRGKMRLVRWGIVILLLVAHLVMNAPAWFLIDHMDVIGGSSGYHRAKIVDLFIRNISDWWLIGTKDFVNWGWEMWDLSNSYVAEGQTGGLVTFIFFLATISRSFGVLGRTRRVVEGDRDQEWFIWFLSAAVFANVIGFFGISYWDQTQVAWLALLAIISAATATRLSHAEKDLKEGPIGYSSTCQVI